MFHGPKSTEALQWMRAVESLMFSTQVERETP